MDDSIGWDSSPDLVLSFVRTVISAPDQGWRPKTPRGRDGTSQRKRALKNYQHQLILSFIFEDEKGANDGERSTISAGLFQQVEM